MKLKRYGRLTTGLVAGLLLAAGSSHAANITGTIKYEGTVPNLKPVAMDADPGCAKKHGTPAQSEVLVLGDGKTLANVFVQVKSGLPAKAYPAPSDPVVIDQEGCQYKPHVLGIMAGQPLKILNSDGLLHNIHALPSVNQPFNQAMPGSVTETVKTFAKPEPIFKIKCDVHPWMGAYVAVMGHPFFGVTGKDGKFSLKGLPAGTYEIEAWHEKLPVQTIKVTVTGDETKAADFTFRAPQ